MGKIIMQWQNKYMQKKMHFVLPVPENTTGNTTLYLKVDHPLFIQLNSNST